MFELSIFEKEILQHINYYRQKQGLQALATHPTIQKLAQTHSAQMAQNQVPFGHDGFEHRATTILEQLGGSSAAENVASGQNTPEAVAKNWIESDGHRLNIEGDYNLTGIAMAKSNNGQTFFTQIFIKTTASRPTTSHTPRPPASQEDQLAQDIIVQINKHRSKMELMPLKMHETANKIAQIHSQNMAKGKEPFGHNGFQERAEDLVEQLNGLTSIAENVAQGINSSQTITETWLDSEGHRVNIEGNYNLTGVGVAKGRNNQWFYTQIFIKV